MRLSQADHQEIAAALRQAQARTRAEINLHILPCSHGYSGYLLLDAVLIAGIAGFALSFAPLTFQPYGLPGVMLALVLLLIGAPFCRQTLIRFLPRRVKHRHAAKQAGLEYLELLHKTPADVPVVLLFISLAERYVHILHSRAVGRDIDGQVWKDIVKDFTAQTPQAGLKSACLIAIESITGALAQRYPADRI